jgi:hypothetical protein
MAWPSPCQRRRPPPPPLLLLRVPRELAARVELPLEYPENASDPVPLRWAEVEVLVLRPRD